MSVILAAPFAGPTKTVKIRNPDLGDADSFSLNSTFHKAMDGTIRSYIYTTANEKFTWHFTELSVLKAQEVQDFLIFANGQDIKLTDFNSVVWKVRCLNNILEFVTRGLGTGGPTAVVKESQDIDLQFEVVP